MTDTLAKEGTDLTQQNFFLCLEVPLVFVLKKLEAYIVGTCFVRLSKALTNQDECINSTTNPPPTNLDECINTTSNPSHPLALITGPSPAHRMNKY